MTPLTAPSTASNLSTASDFVAFFTGCCSEVLDTMYFTTVLDSTAAFFLQPFHDGDLAFGLSFYGDVSGTFGLHLDDSTGYALAANFLGEDGVELQKAEIGDVMGELANILCGTVMSRVPSTQKFVLSHPCPLPSAPDLRAEDALIARLETDAGAITTWLVVLARGETSQIDAARGIR